MIKKIVLFIGFYIIGLDAAAVDQNGIASLTGPEKQDLLLEYMFNKSFLPELIPYVKPYNIYCRIEALQKLRGVYQAGQPAYALSKNICRDICHLIQQASLENRESVIRLFVRYSARH